MNIQKISPSFCASMRYRGPCEWVVNGKPLGIQNEANFDSYLVNGIQTSIDDEPRIELMFRNGNGLKLLGITAEQYDAAVQRADKAGCHKGDNAYEFFGTKLDLVG